MLRGVLITALLVLAAHAHAGVLTFEDLAFQSTGQSMWSEGNALTLDETHFYGVTWNESDSVGGIIGSAPKLLTRSYTTTVNTNPLWFTWKGCRETFGNAVCGSEPDPWAVTTTIPATYTPDTRTGLEGTASTSGRVGFEMGLKADSGSIDSEVGYDVSLTLPDEVAAGQIVNLSGAASLKEGALNTSFPTLEAYAALVLEASASFSGKGCLVPFGCEEFNVSTGTLGGTQELVSINQNGEGTVEYFDGNAPLNAALERALGKEPPTGLPATFESSIAEVTVYLPQPDASGGLDGDVLSATGQDDLLDYFLDVDNIISIGAIGNPYLFGGELDFGIGSVSYDLIDVDLGPTLDLVQSFELSPTLFVDLAFSAPVDVLGFGQVTSLTQLAWDALPDMAFLTDTLVTPTFYLGYEQAGSVVRNSAAFLNELLLDLDGELYVDILQATVDLGIFGELEFGIGEIFGDSVDIFSTPPIFAKSFGLGGFNEESRSFMVALSQSGAAAVPEPGTLSLLGLGLLAMGLLRSRRQAPDARR